MLIGEELENFRIVMLLCLCCGGVGGSVIEGLVRAGIGKFTIVDNDEICLSNLNRQIIATHETIGQKKYRLRQIE